MSPTRKPARPALVVSVPGDDAFLGLIREVSLRMAEHAGFDPGTSAGVAAAVDQASRSAIERGGADSGSLEVAFRDTDRDLEVEVIDFGGERSNTRAANREPSVIDSISHRREAGRNICRLVKHKGGTRAG